MANAIIAKHVRISDRQLLRLYSYARVHALRTSDALKKLLDGAELREDLMIQPPRKARGK